MLERMSNSTFFIIDSNPSGSVLLSVLLRLVFTCFVFLCSYFGHPPTKHVSHLPHHVQLLTLLAPSHSTRIPTHRPFPSSFLLPTPPPTRPHALCLSLPLSFPHSLAFRALKVTVPSLHLYIPFIHAPSGPRHVFALPSPSLSSHINSSLRPCISLPAFPPSFVPLLFPTLLSSFPSFTPYFSFLFRQETRI